ncbi:MULTISPECIES: hypothetical protein [Streptomyces]|uniref:hypothetical protein n=1 Tax=Streptomyces TaxID=1883 RepID=UPI0020104CAE|nr:hypothetical protein [Streptomyces virginiae]
MLVAAASVALAAVMATPLLKQLPDNLRSGLADRSAHSQAPAATGSHPPAPVSASKGLPAQHGQAGSLLTPANIRTTVSSLREASGTDNVISIKIYETNAMAEISPKGRSDIYDNYRYDAGGAARRTGPGGTLDADDKPIPLGPVNWDALPGLLQRAEKELGIQKPTMRFVVIERGLIDKEVTMRVYLIDEYGAGYIQADLSGKVQQLVPRS